MSLSLSDFSTERLTTRTALDFDGPKFRIERQIRGLSQRQIAERAGVTISHVCNIEKRTGRPSPDVAARLVAALDYIEDGGELGNAGEA